MTFAEANISEDDFLALPMHEKEKVLRALRLLSVITLAVTMTEPDREASAIAARMLLGMVEKYGRPNMEMVARLHSLISVAEMHSEAKA